MNMHNSTNLNDFLESISKLPLDDQMMISEIIRKRVIEERRKSLAKSIRESSEEYASGKAGSGTIDDFLNDLNKE